MGIPIYQDKENTRLNEGSDKETSNEISARRRRNQIRRARAMEKIEKEMEEAFIRRILAMEERRLRDEEKSRKNDDVDSEVEGREEQDK